MMFFMGGILYRKKGSENTIVRDYVLPDYTLTKRGYVRTADSVSQSASGTEQVVTV